MTPAVDRRPLPRRFFAADTVAVARALIGATLWVDRDGLVTAGRIVEVEAYLGAGQDPASHAHGGPTPRAAVMFGPAAVAYVYLIYGMHHCFNVVTGPCGEGGAVLIRALEPLVGREHMRARRPRCRRDRELCAGPGRLCTALGLDRRWDGQALGLRRRTIGNPGHVGRVWVSAGAAPDRVVATARIGIREARDWPLRYCDPDSSCLSRPAVVAADG